MELFKFKLFRRKCKHDYEYRRTNKLQSDSMGYPLRLFVRTCTKCGKSEHMWIDVPLKELDEIKTGESVLINS